MKFNRKKCLKWFSPIGWFLLGGIFGGGGIILWYCLSETNLKCQDFYDPWDIAVKLFQIIGAIGTVLAVIVALNKRIYHEMAICPLINNVSN